MPSLSNLLSSEANSINEKPCSLSLNVCKSEKSFPKIFRASFVNKKNTSKASLPPLIPQDQSILNRNIFTPFFKRAGLNTNDCPKEEKKYEKPFIKKRNIRTRFFDHLKAANNSDISFGDIKGNNNEGIFMNKNQ